MTASVEIELTYNITRELSDQVQREAGKVIGATAAAILQDAKDSMVGPKHGRVYKFGKVVHQASAPGEPPAMDTGALNNSGYVNRLSDLEYEVGFSAEYAPVLEGINSQFESGGLLDMADLLGVWMAPNGRALAPRPFLRPAVEREREAFEKAMRKVVG